MHQNVVKYTISAPFLVIEKIIMRFLEKCGEGGSMIDWELSPSSITFYVKGEGHGRLGFEMDMLRQACKELGRALKVA